MSLAATFLGGARGRLLPVSVPFRFFVSAVVFHILFWLVLLAGAGDVPGYTGGPGLPLAALHLLTLGVFAMTATGAAFQLLPVATRQALAGVWPARLAFWLLLPGIPVLCYGMATGEAITLAAGGAGSALGLAVAGALIADNLRRAGDMPVVAAHGWVAVLALAALILAGLALVADFASGLLPDHGAVALTHLVLAAYGFMGFLVLGFSHVLLPMFFLSPAPPRGAAWAGFWLALVAFLLAVAGALSAVDWLLGLATVAGLAAAAVHLWLVRRILRTRMRRRLELSFHVMRPAWVLLPASLLLALALLAGVPVPGGATLFGFLLLAGWLLTFLTAVLQRIMPFLASLHAAKVAGKPPLVSELTASAPLKIHAVCHFLALLLVSAGISLDLTVAVRAGAGSGLAGALAYAWFMLRILSRLRHRRDA